jgi:hypothetical protein
VSNKHWMGLVFLIASLALILSGCSSNKGPAEYLYREADVESVEIVVAESEIGPAGGELQTVSATAIVRGMLSDGCAVLHDVRQVFDSGAAAFILTLTTRRPVDVDCGQGVTPFEEQVSLAIEGLPSGTYTVIANGVASDFVVKSSSMRIR